MFTRDKIAVHINDAYVKIIEGNSRRIKNWEVSPIPSDSMTGADVNHMDYAYSRLKRFIRQKKVKATEILFSISGQDIVSRHIEIPLMNKKNIGASVEWEIKQYLPGGGDNYYIDFQIIEKLDNIDKKVFKVLAIAAPKEKIDNLHKLAERLGLKLVAVDISANCIARVFRGDKKTNGITESVGVIELGDKSSSITILDKGNYFMEREVPFGTDNVVREIARRLQVDYQEAELYLKDVFNFEAINDETEVDSRILTMFDNVFSSFLKVVQFYTTGRVKKPLDEIYIIGAACKLHGLEDYVSNYFNSPACTVGDSAKLPISTSLPENFELKMYLSVLGLLYRKE